LEVTWGNTTALERAITLLIADRESVALSEIQQILAQADLEVSQAEVERAVAGLRLNSILVKEGQRFRLSSAVFADIVRESQEVDILLSALRSEMRDRAVAGEGRSRP
jgi:hypothetical protein